MPRCFEKIISDASLSRESQGDSGTLFLLCSLGRDLATDSDTLTNPYSEFRRRLFVSTGDRPAGYPQTLEALVGQLENRWASRR